MPLDRNANNQERLRRNSQRAKATGTTAAVAVTAPLQNTGSTIRVNLLSTGGLQTSSSQLGIKIDATGTGLSLSASGLKGSGLTASSFVFNETPAGTVDGANAAFTLANTPTAGTVQVYKNGLRMNVGAGNDYTISGGTITFASAPPLSSILLVDYLK